MHVHMYICIDSPAAWLPSQGGLFVAWRHTDQLLPLLAGSCRCAGRNHCDPNCGSHVSCLQASRDCLCVASMMHLLHLAKSRFGQGWQHLLIRACRRCNSIECFSIYHMIHSAPHSSVSDPPFHRLNLVPTNDSPAIFGTTCTQEEVGTSTRFQSVTGG